MPLILSNVFRIAINFIFYWPNQPDSWCLKVFYIKVNKYIFRIYNKNKFNLTSLLLEKFGKLDVIKYSQKVLN
jgi:hypothetical protein